MKNEMNNYLGEEHVPKQTKGSEMHALEEKELTTEQEANRFFAVVKERLLDVNNWGTLAKVPVATFSLLDTNKQEVSGEAKEGYYFKIDIPGPGTHNGEGFDWVKVESIVSETGDDQEYLSMRVRPVSNPNNDNNDVAHFLTDDATSTFQVKRIGKTIYAEEFGRNELPNNDTNSTIDNLRNTMVGWGAKLGLSYPQWKSLVKGLLDN